MALFKVSHGNSVQLEQQSKIAGYCWFTTDDGKFYIDWTTDPEGKANITRTAINALKADIAPWDGITGKPDYFPSNTAGATEATKKIFLIGAETQTESTTTYSNQYTYLQDTWLYTPGVITSNFFKLKSNNGTYPGTRGEAKFYSIASTNSELANDFVLQMVHNGIVDQQFTLRFDCNTSNEPVDGDVSTVGSIKFWHDVENGTYISAKHFQGTYFNGYALGNACAKFYIDKAAATAITKSADLITAQAVYYGLPFINNTHNYTSNNYIWAPTETGNEGDILVSAGSDNDGIPVWISKNDLLGDINVTPDQLDTSVNVGDPWTPIYFYQGEPTQCDGQFLFYEELSNVINFTSPDTMYLSTAGGELTGALVGTTATFDTVIASTVLGDQVFGAVWNDYAEYRMTTAKDNEPGRVVREYGNDLMVKTTERLMAGCKVVSDTYGFAIGETGVARTPIAVSGRVLAYPYEDRSEYSVGDAVCSGPNGTISKMTREEIINYPDRIIGTVSSIPEYSVWGPKEIPVNGRIWIYVR